MAFKLHEMDFEIVATTGTAAFLRRSHTLCSHTFKVHEERPNLFDLMKEGRVGLVIKTSSDADSAYEEKALRRCAIESNIPYITTVAAAEAAVHGIRSCMEGALTA